MVKPTGKAINKAVIGMLFLIFMISLPARADMFTPSHSCSKPIKPYEFRDEWEYDNFMGEVRTYKSCITDFDEEQEDASRKHQDAAEEATEEWNNFVSWELN